MFKKIILSVVALIGMTLVSYGANHVENEDRLTTNQIVLNDTSLEQGDMLSTSEHYVDIASSEGEIECYRRYCIIDYSTGTQWCSEWERVPCLVTIIIIIAY